MKFLRAFSLPVVIVLSVVLLQACAAKKPLAPPPPQVTAAYPPDPAPVEKPAPAPVTPPTPPPAPPAPAPIDYTFSNIQFEFNSGILKTDSYPIMDKAALAMKANPSIKFNLNGYASAEGTDAHNKELSVQRANAVKSYLVNSGVNGDNLIAKGFGESNPVVDNTTEEGRVLNRRVEIKKIN